MIFKCRNCGGNVVYEPDKRKMICPHCESEESQVKTEGRNTGTCPSCGAPLEKGEYGSAGPCPSCGNYLIYDERVSGNYQPDLILPFKISRQRAKEILRQEFGARIFSPSSFLSEAALRSMEGIYVPFWMYDYDADVLYQGEGVKIKTWRSGDTQYTETSHYLVERELGIAFDKIPVDASIAMDDAVMDMMEPYNYSVLEPFEEKYISGFTAEVYNQSSEQLKERAESRARQDAQVLLNETLGGYHSIRTKNSRTSLNQKQAMYALMPVWLYEYRYRNKNYRFYVNGQTGKVIGATPVSAEKTVFYGISIFGFVTATLTLLKMIAEVL